MSGTALFLVAIALLALTLAISVSLVLHRLTRLTGFVSGRGVRVVASDVGMSLPLTLRDPRLGLSGKPDYIVEISDVDGRSRVAPVEVKPTRTSTRLYDTDKMQLAAYLVALRASAGDTAAPFGYVRYASATFILELTPDLVRRVEATVRLIRHARSLPSVHRDHASVARCRGCVVRDQCGESLVG